MLSDDEIQHGYWVAHGWPVTFLTPLREVDEYAGQELLSIAYAKAGDTKAIRDKRLKQWIKALPGMKIKMLNFHAIHQDLFDAATQITGLEALSTGSGHLRTIASIANCKTLKALMIMSRPSLTGLKYLNELPNLKSLAIENVREAQDLSFVAPMTSLEDFSICGSLWTIQKVNDFWPLINLQDLQVLRFYSTRILNSGLQPLYNLKKLVKIECSLYSTAEFKALRDALPGLKYGTPIDYA